MGLPLVIAHRMCNVMVAVPTLSRNEQAFFNLRKNTQSKECHLTLLLCISIGSIELFIW